MVRATSQEVQGPLEAPREDSNLENQRGFSEQMTYQLIRRCADCVERARVKRECFTMEEPSVNKPGTPAGALSPQLKVVSLDWKLPS